MPESKLPPISPAPRPPLVLKLCGKEWEIKRPLTMWFWAWFWETLDPEGKDIQLNLGKMNLLMPAAMSYLTKMPEEEILRDTPDEDYLQVINDLMDAIVEEGVNANPFFRKGMIHAGMMLRAKRTQAEQEQAKEPTTPAEEELPIPPETTAGKPNPVESSPGTGSEPS